MVTIVAQTAGGLTPGPPNKSGSPTSTLYKIESRLTAFKNLVPAFVMLVTDIGLTILSLIPAIFSAVARDYLKRSAFCIIVDLSAIVGCFIGIFSPKVAVERAKRSLEFIVEGFPVPTSV